VSKQRIEQTIYAEYAELRDYIENLRGDKAVHTILTLSSKWNLENEETLIVAQKLEKIGFFELRGDLSGPRYRIPFIYRPYLEIIQGTATIDREE